MATSPEMAVVGTYVSEEEAEQAREHLIVTGVEPIEVNQRASDVWQVEAPSGRQDEALAALQRMEQHTISDAW